MSLIRRVAFGCWILLAASFAPSFALGQAANEMEPPEKVRFDSPDGVKLRGSFFRSPIKAAPAVILVHNIGESSNKKDWIELAKTLQSNFSVLAFDLRGHGESTEIDQALYFHYPINRRITKGGTTRTKIDYKDIDKSAYSVFINDIAAAKSYLERTKNDLGMCNTQSTVVIGVEQGATLAAIWANSEWYRYKIEIVPNPQPLLILPPTIRKENRPEGQYLAAFVGISTSAKLGTIPINLARTLEYPCRVNGMPAVFVHGDGDPKDFQSMLDRKVAMGLDRALKLSAPKGDAKLAFTRAVEIKEAGKLRGVDLLLKSLKTASSLNEYLKTVVQENAQEWTQRDFVKNNYAWVTSTNPNVLPTQARVINQPPFPISQLFPPTHPLPDAVQKNIIFDMYDRFLSR